MQKLRTRKRIDGGDDRSGAPWAVLKVWGVGIGVLVGIVAMAQIDRVFGQEPPAAETDSTAAEAPGLSAGVPRVELQQDAYRYDPKQRRNPMEPLIKEKLSDELVPVDVAQGRPSGPLEKFDVSALKLIAVVWGELGRKELIKAPDGKSYFVTVDTYMGKYGGRVIAVDDDRLVIKELYKNIEEKVVPKTLTIPLRRKDQKKG